QSLVAMYGRQWLKQAGLEQGTDYEMRAARTDLGVGRMLLAGDVVAAIMSNGEFRVLPPDELSRLKVVEVFAKIPNFIFMAHPRIERARLGRLKTQLQGFFADAEEGAPFAQASGFTGIVEVDPATMRELDSFADTTRRAMGTAP
ncbi:MAG: PhnD/SsuA/transferrin family substrate-binding protein, partial [Rubrivivax sp.]|nr:PhnD/SsuA/transferrin family substrate-binding protein [Rubrivivax sp.]